MLTRRRHDRLPARARTGSVLVEFAFIALAFYLLLAGTLELGRMITMSQTIQNAARVGARELALIPLPPTMSFRDALNDPRVKQLVYDEEKLAWDVTANGLPNTDAWPVINRMLLPVMIYDIIGNGPGARSILHFPGALVSDANGHMTVGVPQVVGRDASTGVETIRWLHVVEEVRSNPNDLNSGPFSLISTGPERGLVALRVNCPYQASTMTAYQLEGGNSTMRPVQAADGAVQVQSGSDLTANIVGAASPTAVGSAYAGQYGLGQFYAMGGLAPTGVRPYRRLITAQSLFRREVFAATPPP